MFKRFIAALTLAASAMMGGAALANPVYFIATVSVTDWESYNNEYSSVAVPGIIAAGGEILVATPEVTVAEGNYPHNWTVIVRFESQEAALGFYTSEEYQAVIPIRHASSDTETSVLMLAPEFGSAE
ncbi:MAG: DUF1330 domain-containing protein [Thalassovita sp.]|nr:DUF1330 domain-containing protein [Thalassovita sp.]